MFVAGQNTMQKNILRMAEPYGGCSVFRIPLDSGAVFLCPQKASFWSIRTMSTL